MMKRILFTASFALSAGSAFSFPNASQDRSCPEDRYNGASLTGWREKAIALAVDGQFGEAREWVKKCFPAQVPACVQDLYAYVDHKTAPNVGNLQEAIAQAGSFKSPKDLPEEFWVKDANGEVSMTKIRFPKDIIRIAKEKGWPATPYRTRSTGGFEFGGNLFVVVVPGEKRDVALQVELPPGGDHNDPMPELGPNGEVQGRNTLTMIAVDKTHGHNSQAQLRKTFRASGAEDVYNWPETPATGCMSCHANPFRPISPVGYRTLNGEERFMTPEHKADVDAVNHVLNQDYSTWQGIEKDGHKIHAGRTLDEQPVGWAPPDSPTRKQDYIEKCAENLQSFTYSGFGGNQIEVKPDPNLSVNWKKIRTGMACYSCHNGDMRGTLGVNSFGREEIQFKLLVDRSVPEGMDLNINERLAIYKCLYKEANDVKDSWKTSGAWMKRQVCQDETPLLIPTTHTPATTPNGSHLDIHD